MKNLKNLVALTLAAALRPSRPKAYGEPRKRLLDQSSVGMNLFWLVVEGHAAWVYPKAVSSRRNTLE